MRPIRMNGFNRLFFALLLPASASAASVPDTKTYINIYYLAEEKVAAFDRELEKSIIAPGFLQRSKNYSDLLALRILKEQEEQTLREKIELLSGAKLEDFQAALRNIDPAERVALHDLFSTLPNTISHSLPVFYASLAQVLDARKAAAPFKEAQVKNAHKNKKLLKEIESLSATLHFSPSGSDERLDRIRPGAGPEGTLNGSQFPERTWALTYDDGPHITRTKEVFANLKALKKKATFFWLVECLEQVPGIASEGISLGFSVNNHSWTHPNLNKATAEVNKKEIIDSTVRDEFFYSMRPRFFRLPFGAGVSNTGVRQQIADQGMIHVLWNVDTLDWQDKDPKVILERTKKQMAIEKRGIILFHDIHAQSVEASKQLLQFSASLEGTPQAHNWVTLPEIVDQLNKTDLMGDLRKSKPLRKRAAVFPLDQKPVLR